MIVLFTDFGPSRLYTGQVKAVLHRDAPGVSVVDLLDDAPPFRIQGAAYLLAALSEAFPRGTVFLAVVDPGVGGARPPVVVRAGGQWFVGPGNGLFELVLRRREDACAWRITWTPKRLSATFHGRDLFAPVAAVLATGGAVPGRACGPEELRRQDWPDDLAEIIYVDSYGNAITGLRAAAMPAGATRRRDPHPPRAHLLGRVRGRLSLLRERQRPDRDRRQPGAGRGRSRPSPRLGGHRRASVIQRTDEIGRKSDYTMGKIRAPAAEEGRTPSGCST